MIHKALDLFAGPGGWSVACKRLGIIEDGIEIDDAAVATREAAGFTTIHRDVSTFDLLGIADRYDGLIASPPCQTFSQAGKGSGRAALEVVLDCIELIAVGHWPSDLIKETGDERTGLVLEPLRYALAMRPTWIALEQVPTVLPVWEAYGKVLREIGYDVWVGNLQAEQYGVPQTRKRAVLIASKAHRVGMPVPTHSKYYQRDPKRCDPGVKPWVSMAEALGWGMTERPGGQDTLMAGGSAARKTVFGAKESGEWVEQSVDHPLAAICMTNVRPNSSIRTIDNPAPTVAFGHERPQWIPVDRINDQSQNGQDFSWPKDRPATTVAGRELVANPGANANRYNGASKSRNDGVRVTVEEAGALQSFPPDHPWRGAKTKQFQQVGNAIPVLLAEAVLRAVI